MIKIENLSHVYGSKTPFEKTALDNININIASGEFVGIIGHTGSGKSTLIQHLNGLLKPTSGKIIIDGEDIWQSKEKLREVRFKVGLVFQYPEYQLFEETVYNDIAFGPKNMELSKEEIDFRVKEAMEIVGLREYYANKSPFELSGGQKRRVAIAGVIAMRPKVLILDEPTAGLDPKGRDKILAQISAYHKNTGSTVLLVSHSMEDIAKYAQKVMVINKAKIFDYNDVEHVFARQEELMKMRLSVPQITKVFMALKQKGFDLNDVYTVKQAQDEILRYIAAGKGGEQC